MALLMRDHKVAAWYVGQDIGPSARGGERITFALRGLLLLLLWAARMVGGPLHLVDVWKYADACHDEEEL